MFSLESDEARLLLNIALMAVGRNRFQSAESILSALEQFRPCSVELATARGIMLLSAQKAQEAVDYFDRTALPRFPDSAMLHAFKGMAYVIMGQRREAEASLRFAAEQTADSAAAQLAKDLLK